MRKRHNGKAEAGTAEARTAEAGTAEARTAGTARALASLAPTAGALASLAPTAPTAQVFAVAAPGVAPLLAAECVALGFVPQGVSDAGVDLSLTIAQLFALNAQTRLASRVLVRLADFTARDFATLEKQAARVPWRRVLSSGASVRLRVTCRKSRLYHSDAVAERVARAIQAVVRGAEVTTRAAGDDDDREPHVIPQHEPQLIVVRFDHDHCTISADSSGALLHRRGWRLAVARAPLRETLAAAMLAACDWHGERALVDPFGGSGTIGIEAALRARCMAPGLTRHFAMEAWPNVDPGVFAAERARLASLVRPAVSVPIVLRDRDAGAIDAARANAERAGVLNDLRIEHDALSGTQLSSIAPQGLVLSNPPYGLRISEGADLRGLFARLGDVVRAGGAGWQLGLLMPADRALLGQLRLRMESAWRTTNGGIAVELLRSIAKPAPRARSHTDVS